MNINCIIAEISNLMSLKGKVVIVTGASSGIGEALSRRLMNDGARVVMTARNEEKMKAIAAEYPQADVLIVKADVSRREDCADMIAKTVGRFGGIDVLINNAGMSMRAIFEDLDLKVIEQLMNVNFWGTVFCTREAIPYLLKSKGSVVGVSSIAGFQGLPARTGYSSSKFAMHGFLNTLRVETLNQGLHVMIACPGFTESNIRNTALTADGSPQGSTPLDEKHLMSADDVAGRIIRGIEKRKRTLVMTTQGKLVVLLGKFFPKWVDKMTYKTMKKEKNSPLK